MAHTHAGSSSGWILGLNPGFGGFNFHDPSAALLHDGEIVCAVEEERFSRRKGARGEFPRSAIACCLERAGIALDDLDEIAIGYSPRRWHDRLALESARALASSALLPIAERGRKGQIADARQTLGAIASAGSSLLEILQRTQAWETDSAAAMRVVQRLGLPRRPIPIHFVEHHLAHAVSAFGPSGFERATALVLDGVGEVTSASVWRVADRYEPVLDIPMPNSLGYFYAAMTEYLGFGAWDGEGKLMALAPYGAFDAGVDAALRSIARIERNLYDVGEFIAANLGHGLSLDLDAACASLAKVFERRPRRPGEPLLDAHRNIAWAAQTFLERAVVALAGKAIAATGIDDVCVAGGVFLNCKMNMVLRESPVVRRLYVQPVSKDSGLAIGAAWQRHLARGGARHALPSLALGPDAADACVAAKLTAWGVPFESPPDVAREVARSLAHGDIVLWYHGRAEFGPRALGSRSILADPRDPGMSARINTQVKNRDVWRPLCPSILHEHAHDIFEDFPPDRHAPFMVEAYRVKDAWRARIPAVIHPADGTARPQTVVRDTLPAFHDLLTEFHRLTGVPALLNTSMNDKGEPLANSPADAMRLFATSAADVLVLQGHVVRKPIVGCACAQRAAT